MTLTVEAVERTPIKMPMRKRQGHSLSREHASHPYFNVFELELSGGTLSGAPTASRSIACRASRFGTASPWPGGVWI